MLWLRNTFQLDFHHQAVPQYQVTYVLNEVEPVMRYEEMQISVLNLMKPDWSSAISLDIETHVSNLNFLTNHRILAISLSRQTSGNRDKSLVKKIIS